MASVEEFDEGDWQETLAELRLLVIQAGFSEWDSSMAAAIEEEDEEEGLVLDPQWRLVRYAKGFAEFLEVRSRANLSRMREELGGLVRTDSGRAVAEATLCDADGETIASLFSEGESDRMIAEITAFVQALREGGEYFDSPDFEE